MGDMSLITLLDTKSLSRPLTKLIEVVSQGIGTIYQPTHIKRIAKAKAKAREIKTLAQLELSEVEQEALTRLIFVEVRRLRNISKIVESAIKFLPDEVSKKRVDPDWIADFFNCAQDCSNKDMQILWGYLLRNEVDRPGSYSRRTLATLKLLTAAEAQAFTHFCRFVCSIVDEQGYHIYVVFSDLTYRPSIKRDWFISTERLALIGNASLISTSETFSFSRPRQYRLSYTNSEFYIKPCQQDTEVNVHRLTPIGEEFYSIAFKKGIPNYDEAVREYFHDLGLETRPLASEQAREIVRDICRRGKKSDAAQKADPS